VQAQLVEDDPQHPAHGGGGDAPPVGRLAHPVAHAARPERSPDDAAERHPPDDRAGAVDDGVGQPRAQPVLLERGPQHPPLPLGGEVAVVAERLPRRQELPVGPQHRGQLLGVAEGQETGRDDRRDLLGVAVARHGDGVVARRRAVLEEALVDPAGTLVERTGPGVPGHHREPGLGVPTGADLPLGLGDQRAGDPAPPVGGRHVDLLDLVPDHHHEAGDLATHDGDGGVAHPLGGPGPERRLGTGVDQRLRDEPEVAVPPPGGPDVGDRGRVLGTGGPQQRHGLITSAHRRRS
jgi:hypothetical protein